MAGAPLWLLIMRRYNGTPELIGGELNPVVRAFLTEHTHYPPAKITLTTPWCAAAVGACLDAAGCLSTHSAAAQSYESYGEESDPFRPGSILVFTRHDPKNPNARHVGFSEGVGGGPNQVLLRAGNQDNRVCIRARNIADLVASRWPVPLVHASPR